MKTNIFVTAPYNPEFNKYLPAPLKHDSIYQSDKGDFRQRNEWCDAAHFGCK